VRRSRIVARRLGTFGAVALVVGAVLVGTGVAVSARTTPQAASLVPSKKTTTTTSTSTTTTTTTPPPSTTTQPCSAAPVTATGVNTTVHPNTTATMTGTPGTCIVDGTVVTLTGSGFQASLGTFLECNSDANQPVVTSNMIPVSCTNISAPEGPGIQKVGSTGILGPCVVNNVSGPCTFKVIEGTVGPPCAPSSCNGGNYPTGGTTDSTGGSPFVDAAKYPCPPTQAQQAIGDTCGILFGTAAGDAVTVPLSFNTAVAPPPATVGTAGPTTATTAAASAAKTAAASSTKTSPGALAFTGTGPGLWWLALVGMVLMALGLFALAVVDQPRRLVRLVIRRVGRSEPRSP